MITGVAAHLEHVTWVLPRPYRHGHIFVFYEDMPVYAEQGFVNDRGEWLNREDAAKHAIECGQIEKTNWGKDLYSEDLW